jgi:hypothetical protein
VNVTVSLTSSPAPRITHSNTRENSNTHTNVALHTSTLLLYFTTAQHNDYTDFNTTHTHTWYAAIQLHNSAKTLMQQAPLTYVYAESPPLIPAYTPTLFYFADSN